MADLLSERAELARDWKDFCSEYIELCLSNPYDEKDNPMGYINLGTAVNYMCNDMIFPKLTSNEIWTCYTSLLDYRQHHGIMRIRESFARLLTELYNTHHPVLPENLFCVTGVSACADLLAHCLASPEDVFLVPAPMYGRVPIFFKHRSLVDIYPIHIITEDNEEDYPALTLEKVIKAYEWAVAEKRTVRGLFLINPSNPLGEIYPPDLLMKILNFCHKHSLHVIVDEIYALSIFNGSHFHSVLKFSSIPDPERTHVLYGLSKDFGLSGLRVGVIHTTCEPLKKCLLQLSYFPMIPFPVMDIVARYIEDLDWIKNYVSVNQQRLTDKYKYCVSLFENAGIKVHPSTSAFFLWVNFRHICKSFKEEREFFNYLIQKAHLYINPGEEFFCAQPGWFRIVFTRSDHLWNAGFHRLMKAIKEYEQLNK